MGFSEQPNEILNKILNTKTIPLLKRMRLRAVTSRWLAVLEDGLARETALIIRDKVAQRPDSKPDDLVVQGGILTEMVIQTLVRLFPSPTQLSLAFGNDKHPSASWSTVPSLLAQMGKTLTTVKLHGGIDQAVAEQLASALADLPALTSFTLDGFFFSNRLLPHLGPVLSKLETFVCPYDGIEPEAASIIASSLSPRCTRLLLDQKVFDSFPAPLLSQLSASLTHLSLLWCGTIALESLSQMHGLTSLSLGFFNDDPIDELQFDSLLFRELAPFGHLTDLKLFDVIYDAQFPIDLPSKKEKPLATIKRLTLEVLFYDGYFSDDDELHHEESLTDDAGCQENDEDSPDDNSVSLDDFQTFFKALGAWFPSLSQLTLVTCDNEFPAIRACLGNLPFSVKIVDTRHFDCCAQDW